MQGSEMSSYFSVLRGESLRRKYSFFVEIPDFIYSERSVKSIAGHEKPIQMS